jgi:hypothetical protein
MEETQVQPGETKGAFAAGPKQLALHCASWKHENPRRKENWQRTRRTLQQKKQMRAVKIEDDSRTQPGGDGLSRKNQNRPAGENRAPEQKALKNENRFAND